jgi:hypothetical protein
MEKEKPGKSENVRKHKFGMENSHEFKHWESLENEVKNSSKKVKQTLTKVSRKTRKSRNSKSQKLDPSKKQNPVLGAAAYLLVAAMLV